MADSAPTLDRERGLWRQGYRCVAGVDEAGRGALAGPVVAAAVVVPAHAACRGCWAAVRDSKLLRPESRRDLAEQVRAAALAWAVGVVSAADIDCMGIAAATRLAMQLAVEELTPPADYLLLDWVRLSQVATPQQSFTKADRDIVSVAAASILAKVHRDALLVELDGRYPGFGFAAHKGYGSQAHLTALKQHGPCPEHRHSFSPIARKPTLFDPEPGLEVLSDQGPLIPPSPESGP